MAKKKATKKIAAKKRRGRPSKSDDEKTRLMSVRLPPDVIAIINDRAEANDSSQAIEVTKAVRHSEECQNFFESDN